MDGSCWGTYGLDVALTGTPRSQDQRTAGDPCEKKKERKKNHQTQVKKKHQDVAFPRERKRKGGKRRSGAKKPNRGKKNPSARKFLTYLLARTLQAKGVTSAKKGRKKRYLVRGRPRKKKEKKHRREQLRSAGGKSIKVIRTGRPTVRGLREKERRTNKKLLLRGN